ncbi:MAG: hypothetical protein K1Y36_25070 [Blastocatellia bacterium]|nr:hypothetical protein [Blastocatellia bacterium]
MNIYFLLEGAKTEPIVYQAWLAYLAPHLTKVKLFNQATHNNFYLFSVGGVTQVIPKLPTAIEEVNQAGNYDFLVVSRDSEDLSVAEIHQEVDDCVRTCGVELNPPAQLVVIVQNRCIETWFLGNRAFLPAVPGKPELQTYLRFYDVSANDPELMPAYPGITPAVRFHHTYFSRLHEATTKKPYSKRNPQFVVQKDFLDQLVSRTTDHPGHLQSFQDFLTFCARLKPAESPA